MLFEQPLRYAVQTDVGLRRQNNEDSSAVRLAADRAAFEKHGHLLLVADGMGGHAVGELASGIASEEVPKDFLRHSGGEGGVRLADAVRFANAAIYSKGQSTPDFARMGTTCTALAFTPEGAVIAHVGDSRCYRVRGGRCDQLTFDHSLQWELIRQGMDPQEATLYEPRNVITRSLGPEPEVAVDVEGPFAVRAGDVYVLCSDGLTGHVQDHEIGAVAKGLPPDDAAKLLVNLANVRGGSDNTTVVVARIGDLPDGAAPPPPDAGEAAVNPYLLSAAWVLAGVFAAGVWLLISGAYLAGTLTAFAGLTLASGVGFRIWQKWYHAPREHPLHAGGSETTVWRAYRSAPAVVDKTLVGLAAQLAAQLRRSAEEEGWPVDLKAADARRAAGAGASANGDLATAFRHFARAIDVQMKGLVQTRRAPVPKKSGGGKPRRPAPPADRAAAAAG